MITKMSHTSLFVLNQDEALDFYKNKLGFEVRMDSTMDGGFRWITVGPKNQPDHDIVLMSTEPGMLFDEKTSANIRELVKQGKLGAGVFECDNCRATYEELKAKGVEFMGPPEEKFYGIEAILKDNSGNWFSMTERPKEK
jgi:catechol 2,3-dioxygenase-like lactoylglutathione lyase family enzyme